jgi:hypothetical protein
MLQKHSIHTKEKSCWNMLNVTYHNVHTFKRILLVRLWAAIIFVNYACANFGIKGIVEKTEVGFSSSYRPPCSPVLWLVRSPYFNHFFSEKKEESDVKLLCFQDVYPYTPSNSKPFWALILEVSKNVHIRTAEQPLKTYPTATIPDTAHSFLPLLAHISR